MSYITILMCLICAGSALIALKDVFNPQFLFCSFMGLITILASVRLFGLTETNFMTYLIVMLGVMCFSIGVSLSRVGRTSFRMGNISTYFFDTANLELRSKFIAGVATALLFWSIYRMWTTVIPLLRSGFSLDMIRLVYFGIEVQGYSYSRLDEIIEMFLNLPFLYALIPVVAIELTSPKEKKKLKIRTSVIILLWIVLSCIISGGRVLLYNFVVVFVVCFFIRGNKWGKVFEKAKRRMKWLFAYIVLIMIYVMYQLSINRSGTGTYEFLYQIYVYFCGCMPHTSLRLETVDIDYTLGMTFLSGCLRPFMLLFKYTIGGGNFPEIYQRTLEIGETLQSAVQISEGHTFNAFALPFYYFYYDGGVIAVIIESFIYGFICGRAFFRYRKYPTERNLAKYLVIIIYIANSMIRFSPALVYFAFAYIYVDFCFVSNYKKIGKEHV